MGGTLVVHLEFAWQWDTRATVEGRAAGWESNGAGRPMEWRSCWSAGRFSGCVMVVFVCASCQGFRCHQRKMQTSLSFEDPIGFGVKNTSEHMLLRLTLCTYEEEFGPQSRVQFLLVLPPTKTMERGGISFASKITSLRDCTSPNKPNKHAVLVSPWCLPSCFGFLLCQGRSTKRFFGHKVPQVWNQSLNHIF